MDIITWWEVREAKIREQCDKCMSETTMTDDDGNIRHFCARKAGPSFLSGVCVNSSYGRVRVDPEITKERVDEALAKLESLEKAKQATKQEVLRVLTEFAKEMTDKLVEITLLNFNNYVRGLAKRELEALQATGGMALLEGVFEGSGETIKVSLHHEFFLDTVADFLTRVRPGYDHNIDYSKD